MAGQGSIAVPQQHHRTSIFQRSGELPGVDQAGKTAPVPVLSEAVSCKVRAGANGRRFGPCLPFFIYAAVSSLSFGQRQAICLKDCRRTGLQAAGGVCRQCGGETCPAPGGGAPGVEGAESTAKEPRSLAEKNALSADLSASFVDDPPGLADRTLDCADVDQADVRADADISLYSMRQRAGCFSPFDVVHGGELRARFD